MTSVVRQKLLRHLGLGLGLLAAAVVLVTCASRQVGRQHWSKKWGPLVPHKTFPGDCSLCHVADSWTVLRADFKFDHAEQTGVPLLGAHARAACLRCHNDFGPVAAYVARGCAGCHTDIHEGQLGADCTRCHSEGSWRAQGLIAEHARTRFPLVGRHTVTPCILCHKAAPTGEYRGAPLHCVQCHRDDLARARAPDHQSLGWVNRCERCHVPTQWGGAGFLHAFWPLTGAHAVVDCSACHTGGTLGRLSRDCLSCHQDDHARAQDHDFFPRTCQSCHNTTAWEGAVFNHRFPIRGPHKLSCNECHTTPNPRVFTCIACHEHRQSEMDDKHSEEPGYSYDSASCLRCHPNGDH